MTLIWTRDSICAADDCRAPNSRTEKINGPLTAEEVLKRAANYVPKYRGAVWTVWAENLLIGYLEADADGTPLVAETVLTGTLIRKPKSMWSRFVASNDLHLHCSYHSDRLEAGLENVKSHLKRVVSLGI